jgi:oxalate decarboxylase/phosphoglucose isomerase-like protein (cupin superfamily)
VRATVDFKPVLSRFRKHRQGPCRETALRHRAVKNVGDEELEIVQTWDNGKFEEIDLDQWVRSSPNYLLANNFAGVPESTIGKMKQT